MTDTAEQLDAIVRVHSGYEKPITANTTFIDDMGLDSLDVIELGMRCEEAFGLPQDSLDAPEANTFGHLVTLIDRLRG